MITMPKRNLAPESEPWGRKVDERLDTIEKTAFKNQQDTSNSQKAINATVTKLSEQVAVIDALTQELAEQQETLRAQQSQLSAQVEQIQSVIDKQVFPVTNHTTGLDFSLSPLPTRKITGHTITVPSGYTKALVYTTVTMSVLNNSGVEDNIYAHPMINGVKVGYSAFQTLPPHDTGSVTRSVAELVTSLGSGRIEVDVYGASGDAVLAALPGYNTLELSTMVIFLR